MAKKHIVKISRQEFSELIVFAVRYALGRRTYAPGDIASMVKTYIDDISNGDIDILKRDIMEHGGYDHKVEYYGDTFDYHTWMNLVQFLDKTSKYREENNIIIRRVD